MAVLLHPYPQVPGARPVGGGLYYGGGSLLCVNGRLAVISGDGFGLSVALPETLYTHRAQRRRGPAAGAGGGRGGARAGDGEFQVVVQLHVVGAGAVGAADRGGQLGCGGGGPRGGATAGRGAGAGSLVGGCCVLSGMA